MSALPPIADIRPSDRDVCWLFDYLIGAGLKRLRHRQAKCLGGFQIDDEFVFVRSPRRQRRPRQARGKTKQRSGDGDQLGHRPVVVRQRHAARFRDAAAVGNKTARDAVAVRDELCTNGHGVVHTGLLVFRRAGRGDDGCESKAKRCKRQCGADFHGTLPIYGIGAPDRALRLSGIGREGNEKGSRKFRLAIVRRANKRHWMNHSATFPGIGTKITSSRSVCWTDH